LKAGFIGDPEGELGYNHGSIPEESFREKSLTSGVKWTFDR
jgi:hypothetical protein